MKKSILLCLTTLFCANIFSQTFDSLKLNDLNIPTSPALVFTDQSPSSIEKPTTPKAFNLSLINLFQGGAVEVAPYWFWNHKALTIDALNNQKFPVIPTFALSTATTKTDTSSTLSVGFRTQIFRLLNKSQIKTIQSKIKTIEQLLSVPREELPKDTDDIKKALVQYDSLLSKPLIVLEIAGAYLGNAANNSYKDLGANKMGVWLNLSISPPNFPLDILGLARYSKVVGSISKTGSDSSFIDFGVGLSFLKKNFDLEGEYLNRKDFITKANYDRLVFVINYQITESLTAVASFGKNFGNVNNIVSLFGIKVGLSNQKIKAN